MTSSGLTQSQTEALARQLSVVRDRLHSSGSLGQALVDYVLTEAPTRGTVNGDWIEVPLSVSIGLPVSRGDAPGQTVDCWQICISAFGHHIACYETCITTTTMLRG